MSQETDLPIRLVCISVKNTVPGSLKASRSAGGGGVAIETAYLPVAFWIATPPEYRYTCLQCIHSHAYAVQY